MTGKGHQKWWISMLQTQIVSQRKLSIVIHLLPLKFIQKERSTPPDYHLSFNVFQTSGNPSLINFHVVRAA